MLSVSPIVPNLSGRPANPIRWPKQEALAVGKPSSVRFGGLGDSLSAFISLIDRSRAAELVSSDGLGMLAPRTAVAAGFRGADDARETLIREAAGLFCVALLAGLGNQFMVRVLGNRVGFYNPHGLPGKAWIGAKSLRTFSQLYDQALETHGSISEARKGFIRSVLEGLESGDRQLSVQGRLTGLKALLGKASHSPEAEKALRQMMKESGMPSGNAKRLYQMLQQGELDKLGQAFLDVGWGRLTPNGQKELAGWFAQKASGSASVRGTSVFDQMAWQSVRKAGKGLPDHALHSAFLRKRLALGLQNLKALDVRFAKEIDQVALDQGLTSEVRLKAGGKTLLAGQSRQRVLQEMKYFLEYFVDSAGFEVSQSKGLASHLGLGPSWKAQREMLRQKLFASEAKGLARLFPQVSDGLVSAALKAKAGYTWAPIAVAILANGLTTFLNNYVTQWKYGGKVFFPGEEAYATKSNTGVIAYPMPSSPMMNRQSAWNGRLV